MRFERLDRGGGGIRQALLKDFILQFRTTTTRFYYHTDSHAIDRVVAALKVCAPE